jgi:hypothetical protein
MTAKFVRLSAPVVGDAAAAELAERLWAFASLDVVALVDAHVRGEA